MPTAAILSQGNELVEGHLDDANAPWIARQLTSIGFEVQQLRCVRDDLQLLARTFHALAAEHDVVICTGGLGPTEDDLTAAAVAAAFKAPLWRCDDSLRAIEARYAARGRSMPEANRKQAMFPQGAEVLPNGQGTAPGFVIPPSVLAAATSPSPGAASAPTTGAAWLCCLPGVPHEMRAMFTHGVLPRLQDHLCFLGLPGSPRPRVTFHTTGLGESEIQRRLGTWVGPGHLAYRCAPGRVSLTLAAAKQPLAAAKQPLEVAASTIERALGPAVFAVERGVGTRPPLLAAVVGEALQSASATLAVAESCTGGQLAALCTDVPGASGWFLGGVVSYHNDAKAALLGVAPALIAAHGAVSEPVARAMAEGARERFASTYSLALTGVAGPGGGTPHKPVGTVYLALASPAATLHRRLQLGGDRATIQQHAAHAALDLLRRELRHLPLDPSTS